MKTISVIFAIIAFLYLSSCGIGTETGNPGMGPPASGIHGTETESYDANGIRTTEVNSYWDANASDWDFDSRNLLEIDINGNPTNEIHYQWDTGTDEWKYLEKEKHYYTFVVTDLPDTSLIPEIVDIQVYPNPVMDYMTIETPDSINITKVEIVDLYGRILSTTDNINNTSVTIQKGNLQTGIYILRIHTGNYIHTADVMVR